MRRLEHEIAEAKAGQAELARRLELFEQIAAAAGAELTDSAPTPVPPSLVAAARDSRPDATVHVDVDGREFVAVVGGEDGDPRAWWTAIRNLAGRSRSAS